MKTYKNKFFDKIGYKHSCIETLLYPIFGRTPPTSKQSESGG